MKTYHVYERKGEYKEYWSCEGKVWHYLGNWYSNIISEHRLNGWAIQELKNIDDRYKPYDDERLRDMTEEEYLEFAEICLLI